MIRSPPLSSRTSELEEQFAQVVDEVSQPEMVTPVVSAAPLVVRHLAVAMGCLP